MELDRYLDDIHAQLDATGLAGGEEARELAQRLAAPLDAAIRLAIQDALAAAADEITVDLAPGSVELRLRGREPRFVVTLPEPTGDDGSDDDEEPVGVSSVAPEGDSVARINVRMPEHLKARVDRAAEREGLSVNTWLVRAAAARLEHNERSDRRGRSTPNGAHRYQGWAR